MLPADQIYINNVMAKALNHSASFDCDAYRPTWHFSPQFGLLNDPNGLAYFNGEYHLFYQWNPMECSHGPKAWGHATSTNFVDWTHQPIALSPTETFETHGCYSGSGLVVDNKLELFYTGNVKYDDGGRTAYQCRAVLEKGKQVEKTGIVLELPEGYSGHVRDPKVWLHEGTYYMVLGAEDLDCKGKVLVYRSSDLNQWEMIGEMFGDGVNGFESDDFMLECPDLFALDGKHVLITCPKNWIERDGQKFETFDVTAHIGDFDHQTAGFKHDDGMLMDHGFDFYAPQTFEDGNGRRVLFGWMGKPDEYESYQPTIEKGWIHQMTCPRELTLFNGKLRQNPVQELREMRNKQQDFFGLSTSFNGLSAELKLQDLAGKTFTVKVAGDLKISVSESGLETHRINLKTQQWETIHWQGRVNKLHLLRDASSLEVFINEGEGVSTSRFFGKGFGIDQLCGFVLQSEQEISATHWTLKV
ncbi:sucrose-6-phosphate hydrolase [Vibrio campbellii]|uniref:glycoside hydrolase family 32 protein n=1 Tax=Vibrio campbellii TaxID=680 RepID=UPI001F0806B9|nr:sucrose-6-phosphate hydrolase [Vibrio campbellii]UMM04831.1 sucrose-6-phosphate hydrolase [Vibrio campbellii]